MKSKIKLPAFKLRRSIFQKYLFVSLLIVLVSLISLGVTMLFSVANYWENEKEQNLVENANLIADVITQSSYYDELTRTLVVEDENLFTVTIATIAKSTDSHIFVVSNTGYIQFYTQTTDPIDLTQPISNEILGKTASGEFFEFGTMNDLYQSTYYTAGIPIRAQTPSGEGIVAFCFVSTKSEFVSGLTMSVMKLFLSAAFITMLIGIVLIGILSYNMARPLRQMSNAAKKIATGDFSVRVKVQGEDEVAQLAKAFNHMADSLSASEGMRRSFIANVSHELKTPMTTIAGFIDGMLDGTIDESRHSHYMKIVSNEVKRLSRLVQSMLSLSRIDNGELKLSRQDFELSSILINILASFEQKIVEKNIEIRGLENFRMLSVNADPDLMYQVIYNLIENAVKFTNQNGYILFSTEKTRYDISVSIENSGPGIPPEDIRYVFDRFYKTDKSRSVDKKGMGLGLFITKSIMLLHGGYIFVESEPDNYCRFTFNLPTIATQSEKDQKSKYIETTAKPTTEDN